MRANDSPWWHTEVGVSAMVTSILLFAALHAPLIVQCAITHTATSLRSTTASDNEHMSEGENSASAGDGAVVVVVGGGGVTACGFCCGRACWGPGTAFGVAAAAFATVIATGVSYRNNQRRCYLFLARLIKPLLARLVPPFLLQRHRLAL